MDGETWTRETEAACRTRRAWWLARRQRWRRAGTHRGVPASDGRMQVEDQDWEQEGKTSLEHGELKMPVRRLMVRPRMQLDYVDTAVEQGERGERWEFWGVGVEVYIEKRRKSESEL